MSHFVAIRQHLQHDRIEGFLQRVRSEFARSQQEYPGRRHDRVFQSLRDPSSLLAIGEWAHGDDFERFRRNADSSVMLADPLAEISHLVRLRQRSRLAQRATIVACAIITGPPELAEPLARLGMRRTRSEFDPLEGLVSIELYRMVEPNGRFLSVHSWRTLDDLRRFVDASSVTIDAELTAVGATIERFAGRIAAEYRSIDLMPEAEPSGLPPD
jgi:heme-degrading monooxygenase HmoA